VSRSTRLRKVLAGAGALLVAASALTLTPAAAHDTGALKPGALSMTVASVTPYSPAPASSPRKLYVDLEVVNNTGQNIPDVTVHAVRGTPIYSQKALEAAIANPKPPSSDLAAPMRSKFIRWIDKDATATADIPYYTSYDVPQDADLCQCANAIYPLYFTATVTGPDGSPIVLASTQTYLPSFTKQPAKAQIGWLWPLLDRPHRLTNDKLFTDDTLAAEVAPGGRLDQLLSVLEKLDDPTTPRTNVPVTIVTDPELIDELAVMSRGYQVKTPQGPVKGSGQSAATSWLQRLRAVLDRGHMQLTLPTRRSSRCDGPG
jgi:hypothetical protein